MATAYFDPQPEDDPGCLDLGLKEVNPSVVAHNGRFYIASTPTLGNQIDLISAPSLDGFRNPSVCRRTTVWKPGPTTPFSAHVWSPKAVIVHGRWWIYASAVERNPPGEPVIADTSPSRRIVLWRGPDETEAPDASGPAGWSFVGPVRGMPSSQWAADPTVFSFPPNTGHADPAVIYMAYSGWSLLPHRQDKTVSSARLAKLASSQRPSRQHMYLVALSSPDTVATRDPVLIATADKPWQFTDHVGLLAGPTFHVSPRGNWAGLLVSAAGSWTRDGYKVGAIRFDGPADPLDPARWTVLEWPILQTWLPGFPHEQPYIPPEHRRIVSSISGAWNGPDCPLGPGSPTIAWTNKSDLRPASPGPDAVPWIIFHANRPDKPTGERYAFAQRLFHVGPAEEPHSRVWVGTAVTNVHELLFRSELVCDNGEKQ